MGKKRQRDASEGDRAQQRSRVLSKLDSLFEQAEARRKKLTPAQGAEFANLVLAALLAGGPMSDRALLQEIRREHPVATISQLRGVLSELCALDAVESAGKPFRGRPRFELTPAGRIRANHIPTS